ncbi:hypothetical protein UlMin_017032 [Ulmus minor]
MASSNRHWPSMFKSKPCNSHHQWQHDINPSLISSGCHRPGQYTSVTGCEERSPEPKPRWNPKPEQIRILEAIFNSGMVNPPRDEIRKIRAQLQEYGQVGDANVFYWFQNRKSRSKHKLRHLQNSAQAQQTPPPSITSAAPSSSSSSSSEKPSPKAPPSRAFSMGFSNITDVLNSPNGSVNQTLFQTNEFLAEPFYFPVTQTNTGSTGFCFPEISNVVHHHHVTEHNIGPCTSLLLSEIMNHGNGTSKKDPSVHQEGKNMMKNFVEPQLNYTVTTTPTTVPSPTPVDQVAQGNEEQGAVGPGVAAKSTVFINDVAFEVPAGPFNVREAFGDEAVLIHSNGQPVLTNQWGVTLHSLQHGAFYYLI